MDLTASLTPLPVAKSCQCLLRHDNPSAKSFLNLSASQRAPEGKQMKAIDILTREHGLILRALEVLSEARKLIEKNQPPPKAFFDKALIFLRGFADQFHHFKEEYLMFGLLALKKGDAFDGPIGGLRFQHERCRACIDGISNSLTGYADGDDIATTTLLENLAAYISLLRRHIYEEDHTFFKMVEKELSREEEDILLMQFNKEDEKMGDQSFYDQNRQRVDEMEADLRREDTDGRRL